MGDRVGLRILHATLPGDTLLLPPWYASARALYAVSYDLPLFVAYRRHYPNVHTYLRKISYVFQEIILLISLH